MLNIESSPRIVKSSIMACGLLACLLLPDVVASAPPPDPGRRPFLLGGIQLNEDDHERWSAALIQAGMNAVEVTVYAHQGAWNTPDLWYSDEEPAVLAEIRAARRNGLQVVLILRVALDHNDPANRFLWHGLIYPQTEQQLAAWFDRYTDFVVKWARVAQAEGVEVLGIASEMNSLSATLPVKEIPELPAYYLDDAKQQELRQLVARHLHLFDDADRIAMGAADFESLDDFLRERNRFERGWARATTFAAGAGEATTAEANTAEATTAEANTAEATTAEATTAEATTAEATTAEATTAEATTVAERIAKINLRRRLLEHHWRQLIDAVRAVYRGRLTLAANFDNYNHVGFWDRLDFIGINAYFPLRASLDTALREADLAQSWRQVFAEIEAFRTAHDLEQQIVFTELGYTRRKGVTVAPWSSAGFVPMWDEDREDSVLLWSAQPIDPAERALAVRALYSAWRQDDLPLAGILYWKLSSRADLGRYEPFMLYLGADSRDPLLEAFTRFAGLVRPLDPALRAAGPLGVEPDLYSRWAGAVARGDLEAADRLAADYREMAVPAGQLPPLHLAVRLGRGDMVRRLLNRGADLGSRDSAGYLPLHWSCYQQDPSLVELLLPPDGTSWRDDLGETPFIKCARLDNLDVMRELLRHRGDFVRVRNSRSHSALRLAADLASAEMVALLVDHGASVDEADAQGVTALHAAARRGDPGIVELLSNVSAAGAKDTDGNRPVSYAAYFGKWQAFRLLWRAKTASRRRAAGRRAGRNASGRSLLHLAAHGGDVRIVETLLRQGFEVDRADRSGRTPLHYAAIKTHRPAARLLLEHGAAVDRADREGSTALHLAAEKDDPHLLRLILARSPATDVAGAGGNTPLHYAASWGRLENVRLLLAAGARPGVRNDQGQTVLEVAEESGRKRVVELLQNPSGQAYLKRDRVEPHD